MLFCVAYQWGQDTNWCLDNEYVGEDIKETIGLSGIGISGLWIFGRA